MTIAILVAGILLTLLLAAAMRWPEWRLPAVAFAILAIPGNVDNLLPQMTLDPHVLPNNTAPIVSAIDLLIGWALGLSIREGRLRGLGRVEMWLLQAAVAFWALAAIASVVNVAQGASVEGALRGVVMLGRVPALLALAIALRDQLADGYRLGLALAGGLVALLANGLYTSTTTGASRFTAATFGWNGFSLGLVVCVLVVTGLAVEMWRRSPSGRGRLLAIACFGLGAGGLFAALATGTRMSILAGIAASLVALVVNRTWWSRRGVAGVALIAVGAIVVGGAAALWAPGGSRAMSLVTDPGETIDIVTNAQGQPVYSPVRTRTHWWRQAIDMVRDDPLTGVGPFEWNVRRYSTDPNAPVVVADPHNTYIQMAAEYGIPTIVAYGLLLGLVLAGTLITAWRPTSTAASSWVATTLVVAALMIPGTELTNSHLFNVRLGALLWMLLGSGLAMTVIPYFESRMARARPARSDPAAARLAEHASNAVPRP